jgi:hypothetical protein
MENSNHSFVCFFFSYYSRTETGSARSQKKGAVKYSPVYTKRERKTHDKKKKRILKNFLARFVNAGDKNVNDKKNKNAERTSFFFLFSGFADRRQKIFFLSFTFARKEKRRRKFFIEIPYR